MPFGLTGEERGWMKRFEMSFTPNRTLSRPPPSKKGVQKEDLDILKAVSSLCSLYRNRTIRSATNSTLCATAWKPEGRQEEVEENKDEEEEEGKTTHKWSNDCVPALGDLTLQIRLRDHKLSPFRLKLTLPHRQTDFHIGFTKTRRLSELTASISVLLCSSSIWRLVSSRSRCSSLTSARSISTSFLRRFKISLLIAGTTKWGVLLWCR